MNQISVEILPLTPELSREFAMMAPMPGERAKKPSRLTWVERKIRDGSFYGVNWAKGIERDTGDVFRLNGQHTSYKLTQIAEKEPEIFPHGLSATVQVFEFDKHERTAIFDIFDNPHSARNNVEMMGQYRAEFPDLAHIQPEMLMRIGNGIDAHNIGLNKSLRYSPRERGLHFHDKRNREFACWLCQFSATRGQWMIGQPGIVAEIYDDFRKSEFIAAEFWGFVFREDHPDVDHETRELVRELNKLKNKSIKTMKDFRDEASKRWKRYARVRLMELELASNAIERRRPPRNRSEHQPTA